MTTEQRSADDEGHEILTESSGMKTAAHCCVCVGSWLLPGLTSIFLHLIYFSSDASWPGLFAGFIVLITRCN